MARFRFLNATQQMAAYHTTGADAPVVVSDLSKIAEVVGGEQYSFAPFEAQPEEGCTWAIRTTIAPDGRIVRRGRLTDSNGRTISVRLWDRDNPIPSNAEISSLEFGLATQGGETITDLVETPRGLVKVARVYARLKASKAKTAKAK